MAAFLRILAVAAAALWAVPALAAAPLVTLTDYVVDGADVLPADREAALIEKLRAHETATSNQVAVATVRTLEGQVIEEAALAILRGTGLGQADRNNGVLLLIAIEERRMRIEVGYGLEGALPDALAGRIISREIAPKFKAGDYPAGIEAGVDAILAAIQGEYVADSGEDDDFAWEPFVMFGAYFVIVAFMVWRRRKKRLDRAARRARGEYVPPIVYDDGGDWGGGWGSGGGGFGGGGGGGGGGGASGGW